MNTMLFAANAASGLRRMGGIALPLSVIGAIVGALVPTSAVGWVQTFVPGLAHAWNVLDALMPGFNSPHIIAYAWVALLWRLLLPEQPRWRMPLALVGIGIGCELLQHFVPNRQPRFTDVLSDVFGIAIGWGLALAVARMWRR